MIERDLAALALLANVAQRRTPFGQGLRSGEMLEPVRAEPARRARLPARGRRDGEMACCSAPTRRPGPAGLPRALHPPAARAGALRGLHRRRHRPSSTRRRSTAARSAEQLLRSTLDQVLRLGFFHADPHPGNIFAFADGTLGLIDFGAVGRLDPIQQAAVVDMLVALDRGATSSLLRDGIERVAEVAEAVSPERLERALARLMAEHVRAERHRGADRAAGPGARRCRSSASACPPTSSCCRGRSSRSTARCGCSSPEAVAGGGGDRDDDVADGAPIVDPRRDGPRRAARRAPAPAPPARARRPHPHADRPRRAAHPQRRRRGRPPHRAHARQPGAARGGRRRVPGRRRRCCSSPPTPGPPSASGTGLFEVFGYGGLLAGTVLLLRVVAAVARDGTT